MLSLHDALPISDVERLLDEALDDILVGAPRPEERRDRHIDHDEGRGEEADLAAEQAETAVDIGREDRQKLVDHAGVFHATSPSVQRNGDASPPRRRRIRCRPRSAFGSAPKRSKRRGLRLPQSWSGAMYRARAAKRGAGSPAP